MSLRDKALAELTLSPLMTNREKANISDICDTEVTLRDFDLVQMVSPKTGEVQDVAILLLDEHPDKFFFGGLIATKLVSSFDENDKAELNSTGLKVKFKKGKATKSGNDLTLVEVL